MRSTDHSVISFCKILDMVVLKEPFDICCMQKMISHRHVGLQNIVFHLQTSCYVSSLVRYIQRNCRND